MSPSMCPRLSRETLLPSGVVSGLQTARRLGGACSRPARRPRTIVLGVGNPLLRDDGVGPRVAQQLRATVRSPSALVIDECTCGGLALMERLVGFERAVIVDALCTGGEPGTVRTLTLRDVPTWHRRSTHDVDLPLALAVGRQAGALLPADDDVRLVGIEAADVFTFGTACTPRVEAALRRAAAEVLRLLRFWR